MKYGQVAAIEQHIQGKLGTPAATYAVIAKDDTQRQHAASRLRQCLPQDHRLFCGGKAPIRDICEELGSFSLLFGAKTIVIEEGEALAKTDASPLISYIERPTPDCILLITAATLSANSKLYKAIDQHGILFDLPTEKAWDKEDRLRQWVAALCARGGKRIAPQAAQALVKQAGGDLWRLEQECEKLLCYVGDRQEITTRDVATLCMSVCTDTGWKLGDALLEGDLATAMRIGRTLLADGHALHALLAQLRGQLQTGYVVASLLESGGTSVDIAKRLPQLAERQIERQASTARSFGSARFRKGLEALYEGDLLARTSNIEPEWVLERTLAKFSKKIGLLP